VQFDETIARLGAKLDAWFDSNQAIFVSEDKQAHADALRAGFAILDELDTMKSAGLAAIAAILRPQSGIGPEEQAAALVRGFEFAARLKAALHDELADIDGGNELVTKMNLIADALDQGGRGRVALAVLLRHADDSVRASAGAYLVDLMPDRVVPILREIDQKDEGTSAGFTAHWALRDWELKQQKAGKTPP
jgi:hypothetical protein